MKYIVELKSDLVKYLGRLGYAKNKVKTYVRLGYVEVNGGVVEKLPFLVVPGDEVVVSKKQVVYDGFRIVYEDDRYLIVDKEAGLLSIHTSKGNKEYEETLYQLVRGYLNRKHEYAFIVNRIDKETSGLVVFVKNEELKMALQEKWNSIVKKRGYIAVVVGKIEKAGRIDNYLYEDKMTFSHSTKIGGKRAITNYYPVRFHDEYTMLDVLIETGRKNQIRVHMKEMGHPILGDKKYGSQKNPLHRLALHHYEICFVDPMTGEEHVFCSEVPKEFYDLFD